MAVRLQKMHPAFVHLPIALLPLAVGADVLGCLTRNGSLYNFGRKAIGLAAVGALGSAVTGLIAGEEVNVEGVSHDMLVTHRNLNFVATVVATSMAVWRAEHDRTNAVYLGVGVAGCYRRRESAQRWRRGNLGRVRAAGRVLVRGGFRRIGRRGLHGQAGRRRW